MQRRWKAIKFNLIGNYVYVYDECKMNRDKDFFFDSFNRRYCYKCSVISGVVNIIAVIVKFMWDVIGIWARDEKILWFFI